MKRQTRDWKEDFCEETDGCVQIKRRSQSVEYDFRAEKDENTFFDNDSDLASCKSFKLLNS
jgi:hypothetical protein